MQLLTDSMDFMSAISAAIARVARNLISIGVWCTPQREIDGPVADVVMCTRQVIPQRSFSGSRSRTRLETSNGGWHTLLLERTRV